MTGVSMELETLNSSVAVALALHRKLNFPLVFVENVGINTGTKDKPVYEAMACYVLTPNGDYLDGVDVRSPDRVRRELSETYYAKPEQLMFLKADTERLFRDFVMENDPDDGSLPQLGRTVPFVSEDEIRTAEMYCQNTGVIDTWKPLSGYNMAM